MSSHHSGPAGKQVRQSWLGFAGVPACVSRGTRRGAPIQGRNKWAYQAGRRLGRPLRALFDDPRDVLVPPGSTASGPPSLSVKGRRNPPQRVAALAQAPDLPQHGLLDRVEFYVFAVRRQPVSELDIPNPLAVHLLVAERVAGPFANGLALPLADRAHDRDDQSASG